MDTEKTATQQHTRQGHQHRTPEEDLIVVVQTQPLLADTHNDEGLVAAGDSVNALHDQGAWNWICPSNYSRPARGAHGPRENVPLS